MMSGIPQRVFVGPHCYRLLVDANAIAKASVQEGAPILGYCEKAETRIVIESNLVESLEREVVVHELLHAMCSLAGLDDELGEDVEERVVTRLAPIIVDVLERNENLCGYLSSK